MKTSCSIPCFLSLVVAFIAQAQPQRYAFSSPAGIYINTGNTIASPSSPVADTTGYLIERRNVGASWSRIASVSAVETVDDFKKRVGEDDFNAMKRWLKLESDATFWKRLSEKPTLQENAILFSSRSAMIAVGLLYLDSDVKKDVVYEYRISTLLKNGTTVSARISTSVRFGEPWPMPSMNVSTVLSDDSTATIEWKSAKVLPTPSTFHVYGRMTGAEEFTERSSRGNLYFRNDSMICRYFEHGLKRNQQYDYFVVPEDWYGNRGQESQIASAYATNLDRILLPLALNAYDDSRGIRLRWLTQSDDYLIATRIYRSTSFDEGFELIAEVAATDSTFLDISAQSAQRYFYRLTNVSYNGAESPRTAATFGYYISNVPPLPPQGLLATSVQGGVRLAWQPNTESDIDGYLVYRSETSNDSLFAVSPYLHETTFLDTSKGMNPYQTYRYIVRARNTSDLIGENSNEAWARPILPIHPDPPASVYAREINGIITVNWSDASERDNTVSGYRVYRASYTDKEPVFSLIRSIDDDPTRTLFEDSSAVHGQPYLYNVSTVDVLGNEGIKSRTVVVSILAARPYPPVDIHAVPEESGIRIMWELPEQSHSIVSIHLYRFQRNGQPERIATVSPDRESYIDTSVRSDEVYYYLLKTITETQAESEFSKTVFAIAR